MLEHEIPSPIKEIMRIGGELVNQYVDLIRGDLSLDQKARGSVVYIGREYFLTFSGELGVSTSEEPVYKAYIYSFPFSSEPMLIFSGNSYHPKAKEFDAAYWLDVVKKAKSVLWYSISIASIIENGISNMAKRSMDSRFPDAVSVPLSGRQPFKTTVTPGPTLGMLTSQVIEETDSLIHYITRVQRVKGQPPTYFADNILGCGLQIVEEELRGTLRILMPSQITDFSKTIEVISSQGTFSVNSEINQEVGLNLGKLRNALRDIRKEMERKYQLGEEQ